MNVPGQVDEEQRLLLHEEEVSFTGAKGDAIDGYMARPAEAGNRPGLLVIHEAYGLNEHIRDVVRRFAAIGYTALAPDLYTREGMPEEPELEEVLRMVLAQPDARAIADLGGALSYLQSRDEVNGSLGCVGFCSGGRQTLMLACRDPRLDAAIDCWGGNTLQATPDMVMTPERPMPPIEMIDDLSCPLMLAVGADDHNPSTADVDELVQRLEQSDKDYELNIYERAGHAFFADYRPNYAPVAADLLWADMTDFLGRHL